jgi:hypothetical protein
MEKISETIGVSMLFKDILKYPYRLTDYDRHALPKIYEQIKILSEAELFELGKRLGNELRKNNKSYETADAIISMMNELQSIPFDNGVFSEGEIHFIKDSFDDTPYRWEQSRFVRVEHNNPKIGYPNNDKYFLTRSTLKNIPQTSFRRELEEAAAYYPDELYEIICNTIDFETRHRSIDRLNDNELLQKIAEDTSFAIDQRMRAAKKLLTNDEYLSFLARNIYGWRPYSMYDLRTLSSDDLYILGQLIADSLRESKSAHIADCLVLVLKELALTAFEDGLFSQGDIEFTRKIQTAWQNTEGFYDSSLEWNPQDPSSCDRFEEQTQYLTRNGIKKVQ